MGAPLMNNLAHQWTVECTQHTHMGTSTRHNIMIITHTPHAHHAHHTPHTPHTHTPHTPHHTPHTTHHTPHIYSGTYLHMQYMYTHDHNTATSYWHNMHSKTDIQASPQVTTLHLKSPHVQLCSRLHPPVTGGNAPESFHLGTQMQSSTTKQQNIMYWARNTYHATECYQFCSATPVSECKHRQDHVHLN